MQAAIESNVVNGAAFPSVPAVIPEVVNGAVALADASPENDDDIALVRELAQHATIEFHTIDKLVRSKYNVRRSKGSDERFAQLKGRIRAQGLLNNLIGYKQLVDGVATGIIEIVAGGRRLSALGELVEEGDLPQDYSVHIMMVSEDEAIELSLSENQGREDMHPADVYEAMQAMLDHGTALEDIAVRFELETSTVRKYLKLANVSPRMMALYRDGAVNFEHMMVFALVDDHATQEQAWDSLPKHGRYPHELRRLLTAQKINTQSDRVARYVGVAAFEKAGGVVVRDMFSKDGTGYIEDAGLLERLAMAKLEKHRAKLLKEGIAWVDIVPRADRSDLSAYGRVRTTLSTLSEADQKAVDDLQDQINAVEARIEDADEDDEELLDQLWDEQSALDKQRNAILATRREIVDAEDQALTGAVVYIDTDGKLDVLTNAIRAADVAKRINSRDVDEAGSASAAKRVKADHSDRLTAELTSHRTVALKAEMMDQSDVALVYLTFTLMKSVLLEYGGNGKATLAKVSLTRASLTESAKNSTAAASFEQRREQLLARLPEGKHGEGWHEWLATQPQAVVLEMLAFCVANSLDATMTREDKSPEFVALGKALKLDMTKWWQPTADAYFDHVPKDRMVKVVTEAKSPEAAVQLESMKKAQAAEAAQRAVADTGWLPELLRTA